MSSSRSQATILSFFKPAAKRARSISDSENVLQQETTEEDIQVIQDLDVAAPASSNQHTEPAVPGPVSVKPHSPVALPAPLPTNWEDWDIGHAIDLREPLANPEIIGLLQHTWTPDAKFKFKAEFEGPGKKS